MTDMWLDLSFKIKRQCHGEIQFHFSRTNHLEIPKQLPHFKSKVTKWIISHLKSKLNQVKLNSYKIDESWLISIYFISISVEITHRFQTARPEIRSLLLQCLLPWLENMELVAANVTPATPLSYIMVSRTHTI